jgi:hypothetical protein
LLFGNHTTKSISKRLSIFFLNGRNRDFGEKIPSNSLSAYLNDHPNIVIFYIFQIFR